MGEGPPDGWRLLTLEELGTVERGRSRYRPRNDPSLYGGIFPFVQTGDVKAATLHLSQFSQTYNEKGLAQSRLWPSGTLCITIAATICDTAILSVPACFPDSIVGFSPFPDVADVVFVKYALDHAKQRFAGISRGATQDNLSVAKMMSQRLPTPPLLEQRRIAAILGAYDDLIEVNSRRIAALEEMARRLFEEWFVHFRFPGHDSHIRERTTAGFVPAGWSVARLGDLVEVGKGVSYAGAGLDPAGDPLVNLKNIVPGGGFRTDGLKRYSGDVRVDQCVTPGDLVMANTDLTPTGRVIGNAAFVPPMPAVERIAFTHHLFALRPLPGTQITVDFLFHLANSPAFKGHARGHANGATILGLKADSVRGYKFALPPIRLVRRFSAFAQENRHLANCLAEQNNRLAASRNLLLPRLVSGMLSVAAAEDELEEAAA